jgi:heterodisulfide reductase subunit A-like polyferredoxin
VYDYDLLVIGSGPGGQKAAFAAAKLDRRVAVVERPDMIGGVCVQTGTIPSKTLREAILYLITVADLTRRTTHVVSRESDGQGDQTNKSPRYDRNISCGTLVSAGKRAPGSVKLRAGGNSPRTGRTSGWPIRWNSGTDG